MTGSFPTQRGFASREVREAMELRAPLREAWSVALDFAREFVPAVLGADGFVFGHRKDHLVAIDTASGAVAWRRRGGRPLLIHGGCVLVSDSEGLRFHDVRTGELVRFMRIGEVRSCLVENDVLVAHIALRDYGVTSISAFDWNTSQGLWSSAQGGAARILPLSAMEDMLCYQVFDGNASNIVMRDTRTGAERWSRADESSMLDGKFLALTPHGLIAQTTKLSCLDLSTGKDRWSKQNVGGFAYVYRGRIYSCGWDSYCVTDVKTGRQILKKTNLVQSLPKSLQSGAHLRHVVFVSETHVFIGSETGALFAFTRDKGEYVSNFHPPGAVKTTELVCIDGRAYHCTGFQRISCLEPRP